MHHHEGQRFSLQPKLEWKISPIIGTDGEERKAFIVPWRNEDPEANL